MASLARRLAVNAPGSYFVDSSCIDCATCRTLAPAIFGETGQSAYVRRQPTAGGDCRRAAMAAVACPVGAIGGAAKDDLAQVVDAFPEPLAGEVHVCGYAAKESYGAASYLIRRPQGNVLVDSPRFAGPLVRRIEAMGGIAAMFLTHKDDIADHARFASHFGCERIMHRADMGGPSRGVERVIDGLEPVALAPDLLAIPVPGHTLGSMCLLYRDAFLFTGDHLAWRPRDGRLRASRDVCWYDWAEQTASMERLAAHRFEWVLPGHGHRVNLPAEEMHRQMALCVRHMKRAA